MGVKGINSLKKKSLWQELQESVKVKKMEKYAKLDVLYSSPHK